MNQLMLESCVHSWDPKQRLQMKNVKGSCPTTYNVLETHTALKLIELRVLKVFLKKPRIARFSVASKSYVYWINRTKQPTRCNNQS
jgi:hypothetical protein